MFILFTDLDGTLLSRDNTISKANWQALQKIHPTAIRVAITGRNLFSATKVLPQDLPIDFLVFSNGAGIIEWRTNRIILAKNLNAKLSRNIADFLITQKVTFTVHRPIPDTHFYLYFKGQNPPPDLALRNNLYQKFISPLTPNSSISHSTCIICMLSTDPQDFKLLSQKLNRFSPEISITRTTSPINHKNIWLEIFPRGVNKGSAAKFLCDYLNISPSQTIAIGNDYNDLSLLEFAHKAFVVENAPLSLKQRFHTTVHHEESAIAEVVNFLGL